MPRFDPSGNPLTVRVDQLYDDDIFVDNPNSPELFPVHRDGIGATEYADEYMGDLYDDMVLAEEAEERRAEEILDELEAHVQGRRRPGVSRAHSRTLEERLAFQETASMDAFSDTRPAAGRSSQLCAHKRNLPKSVRAVQAFAAWIKVNGSHHAKRDEAEAAIHAAEKICLFRDLDEDERGHLMWFARRLHDSYLAADPYCDCHEKDCEICMTTYLAYEEELQRRADTV
jgi:hypothetical protein